MAVDEFLLWTFFPLYFIFKLRLSLVETVFRLIDDVRIGGDVFGGLEGFHMFPDLLLEERSFPALLIWVKIFFVIWSKSLICFLE